MNEARIKLAEAMGRQRHEWGWISCGQPGQGGLHKCKHCKRSYCHPPWNLTKLNETEIFCDDAEIPDPETDANDDVAVLEWVRNQVPTNNNGIRWASHDLGWWFCKHLKDNPAEYEIGDYARAALKALEIK